MRITVIGATGRIGKRVTRALVEQGHAVTAVNRRADRAELLLGDLPILTVVGDATDAESVSGWVVGADAVLVSIAPTREEPRQYLNAHANVIDAVRAASVPRLVAISNHMALVAPDGRPMLLAQPPNPYFREVEEVFTAQAAMYRSVDDTDWLLIAPPAELFPYGQVTGAYRTGIDQLIVTDASNSHFKEVSTLSMEDLADFASRELTQPTMSHVLATAAY